MSLLLPKGGPVSSTPGTGRAPLWIWVGAVLLAGGAGGWTLNQAFSPTSPDEALTNPIGDPLAPGGEDPAASLSLVSSANTDAAQRSASAASLTAIEGMPPPNPFLPQGGTAGASQPFAAAPKPGALPAQAAVRVTSAATPHGAAGAPAGGPPVGTVPAAPAKPSPASLAEVPEGLTLTGIIQGDPALAVLRWNEQTMFLKIGDPIADTWRLDEIRERSVVLRLSGKAGSEQRVEIPLRGGNSQ